MLAMLSSGGEKIDGGSSVFMDTDSVAIVTGPEHGQINPESLTGQPVGVTPLSHAEVEEIVAKFERLNPYDRNTVHTSILKVEAENKPLGEDERALSYDPKTKEFSDIQGSDLKTGLRFYIPILSPRNVMPYSM